MSVDTDMSIPVSYLTSDRGGSQTAVANDRLDTQAFLQLLIAQLRNQDPSSPTDSETILTQTTQLATMETLEEQIATARESFALQMRAAAAGLVGQTVSWQDADGVDHSGTVTAVSYTAAVPLLRVGDEDIPLTVVRTVGTPAGAPADPPADPEADPPASDPSAD